MLAERKSKEKWSQDPRNTFWSKGVCVASRGYSQRLIQPVSGAFDVTSRCVPHLLSHISHCIKFSRLLWHFVAKFSRFSQNAYLWVWQWKTFIAFLLATKSTKIFPVENFVLQDIPWWVWLGWRLEYKLCRVILYSAWAVSDSLS